MSGIAFLTVSSRDAERSDLEMRIAPLRVAAKLGMNPCMLTTREALEAALVRSPDDLALHMAYSDCLIEEGDPRGEWIRLYLAQDQHRGALTDEQRRQIRKEKKKLEKEHQLIWQGTLNSIRHPGQKLILEWRRGWIYRFHATNCDRVTIDRFLNHPYTKLVKRFSLAVYEPMIGMNIEDRVEDFSFFKTFPSQAIRHVRIRDSNFNDNALSQMISSAFYQRLESLDLSHCDITDRGVELLLNHNHTRRLNSLVLHGNPLTAAGYVLLQDRGIDLKRPLHW